ncbi:MAG TPA: GFA family protein [Gaiellaceae bacterium]|nr:GFA family protein [Gaiellaceae bacterium]
MDATAPLTGHCLCGAVRFEIVEPPVRVGYCHCTRCQRRTGTAASLNASLVPGSLRVLEGEALLRAYRPPDGAAKVFCSACGGALWSENAEGQPSGVRLGALDRDPGIPASYRQYVAYAAPWEPIPDDGLPRFPEGRTS